MSCGRDRSRTAARILTTVMVAAVSIHAGGCASLLSRGPKIPPLELIAVAPDGAAFVEQDSGRPFVPFGTNYYDPNTGWAPKVWQQFDPNRVTGHFVMMSQLGINCARVFLAAATFQPDVNTVDEEALAKLDTLVEIARKTRIRLILTGPDHWEGMPAYWKPDRYAGQAALKALENFWAVVGRRYQGEPAILAWDLLNEPEMPWHLETWQPRWNAWLEHKYGDRAGLQGTWGDELAQDEQMGSIRHPKNTAEKGNPRLLDWQSFREHLADEWVRRQVDVLRSVDPNHLITVGYIQWSYPTIRPGDPGLYSGFNPHRQKQWLDFISIHFYPLMGRPYGSRTNWEKNLLYLQSILAYCHTGKPVVLGEYGWYGGGSPPGRPYLSEEQQARWISAEIEASRRLAQGWLSWPFADTVEATDMSIHGGLLNSRMGTKWWALWFRAYAQHVATLPQPTPEPPAFDFALGLTAPMEDLMPLHEEYAQSVRAALNEAGPVAEIPLPDVEESEISR
jgi:hypothetical protein